MDFVTHTLHKIMTKNSYVFLLLLAVAYAVFGNVIQGEFLYDDLVLIVNNEYTKSFSYFSEWFTSNSTAGAGRELGNLFRPIPSMLYTLMYTLFGLNSAVHHSINILIHTCNGYLVYRLLSNFSFKKIICLLTALIFITHPAQAESVSYISGLPDVLSGTFILLALKTYSEITHSKSKQLLKVSLFTILAFLTKELSVIILPLALLIDIYNWPEHSRREKNFRIKSLCTIGALTIIYITLKFTVLNFHKGLEILYESNPYTEHLYVRLFTFISILPEYFKLLIAPIHLYFDKGQIMFVNLFSTTGILGTISVIGTLIGSYYSYKKDRIFLLGSLWFFAALAPTAGIIITNAVYFEHWLYIPIIGALIILCGLYNSLQEKKHTHIFIALTLIAIILLSARTAVRNQDWKNGITFFQNEMAYTQIPEKVHHQLGMVHLENERYDQAISEIRQSLSTRYASEDTYFSLCLAHYFKGELLFAEPSCTQALQFDDQHKGALMTLYNILVQTNQSEKAMQLVPRLQELGITN